MQTRTIEAALDTIKTGNGLTKTVTAAPDSDRCLDYILNQILHPESVRPVKEHTGLFHHYVFNPLTAQWAYRGGETKIRGRTKPGVYHTKKTSTSYLPTDGVTEFFQPKNGHPVTLLFDARLCHLKNEKYIFPHDAQTDQRWWLKNIHGHALHTSIGFAALQTSIAAQRAQGIIPKPTELLVGLSKPSLTAIIVPTDLIADRLRALYTQRKILGKLNVEVAVLLATAQGFQPYTLKLQQEDLLLALKFPNAFLPQSFSEKILSMLPTPMASKIKHDLENFDQKVYVGEMEKIFEDLPSDLQYLVLESMSFLQVAQIYYLALRDESTSEKMLENLKVVLRNMGKNELHDILINQPVSPYFWDEEDSTGMLIQKNNGYLLNYLRTYDELSSQSNPEKSIRIFLLYMLNIKFIDNELLKIKVALSLVFYPPVSRRLAEGIASAKSVKFYDKYIFEAIQKCELSFVQWLIKDVPVMPTMQQKITHDITYDDSGRWSTFKEKYFPISPLTYAAMNARMDTTAYFIKQYPADIPKTLAMLKSMKKLKDISIENAGMWGRTRPEYHSQILSNAHTLITCLRPGKQDNSWTFKEKRLIETLLLEKLATLSTREEVVSFWQEHKDANYLNVRRHGFFDKVFRNADHMCNGKRRVLEKVNIKLGHF